METAISKAFKEKLEKLFEDNARISRNHAKIHVNSIITEDQESKYKEGAKDREEKLKQIDEEVSKK